MDDRSSSIRFPRRQIQASPNSPPNPLSTTTPPPTRPGPNIASIVAIIIVIVLCVSTLVLFTILRRLRAQNRTPKYIPTSYLKSKWQAWLPSNKYGQVTSTTRNRSRSSVDTSYIPPSRDVEGVEGAGTVGAGVNRNTSVRSIMTLPPYSQTPQETEEVIGREGERAGMDTVVEFPETSEEQETQREQEMNSLYQIRQARRREIEEREQRRQERRDARNQGDWARLEQLRRDSRARAAAANLSNLSLNESAASVSAATLLAEHQSRGRERRVSAVTYASLGHVRHDGSRVRANSQDSESGALLDSAAPMGERFGRNRGISDTTLNSHLSRVQTRARSNSSLSNSTNASDLEHPTQGRVTPASTQDAPRTSDGSGTSNSSPTTNRYTPDESTGSDDVWDGRNPATAGEHVHQYAPPPDYDNLDWGEAPAYAPAEGALNQDPPSISVSRAPSGGLGSLPSRAPTLPQIGTLPSINVEIATEPNTPVLS